MIDRILLPLDGESELGSTLSHVRLLAKTAGSEIIVLHAVPFLETVLEMPSELSEGDKVDAECYVKSVVEDFKFNGINARGIVRLGSEVESIAATARRERATMIVLGIHRHPRFRQRSGGALVERVLKSSDVPVYVAPSPLKSTPDSFSFHPRKILIPVDGTGLSLAIVAFAATFARFFGASLIFAHVTPSNGVLPEAKSVFTRALDAASREGVPAKMVLLQGEPAAEIVNLAKKVSADLVAMRTRLTPNQAGGRLGSVMLRVLRSSAIPLLVVRRPARALPVTA